jgi:mRNA-degrading endonuclease RelE of RelBE toxin-antitoxin system
MFVIYRIMSPHELGDHAERAQRAVVHDTKGADRSRAAPGGDRLETVREHANVAALKGAQGMFRLRQGDWRAVYLVDREAEEIQLLDVAPRGSICR